MTIKGPAPRPCESCPYRRDVPSGVWSAGEYVKLPEYDQPMHLQPMAVFQCHQSEAASDQARLCAGWVGCHGSENLLAMRLAVSMGTVPPKAMTYTTDVALFDDGGEASRHGMSEIEDPGPEACALVEKISSHRPDVRLA